MVRMCSLNYFGIIGVATCILFSESSDEDEYADMSEYEKEREKRIKQNKQVLDEIMKEIKKPDKHLPVRTHTYFCQLLSTTVNFCTTVSCKTLAGEII